MTKYQNITIRVTREKKDGPYELCAGVVSTDDIIDSTIRNLEKYGFRLLEATIREFNEQIHTNRPFLTMEVKRLEEKRIESLYLSTQWL